MSEPYWATGPGEILRHGLSLLEEDTDSNRRLAMISIDNSVELMMQTFIQLPKRVTGIDIPRSKRDELCSSFPNLLEGIEQHAKQKVLGLDLGVIEWFHRLRNQLYHQGNGLTVERAKVEAYAELARQLFRGLFDTYLEVKDTSEMRKLGEFLSGWIEIEKMLFSKDSDGWPRPLHKAVSSMVNEGRLNADQAQKIMELGKVRNELVHGTTKPSKALTSRVLSDFMDISTSLSRVIGP